MKDINGWCFCSRTCTKLLLCAQSVSPELHVKGDLTAACQAGNVNSTNRVVLRELLHAVPIMLAWDNERVALAAYKSLVCGDSAIPFPSPEAVQHVVIR